VRLRYGPCITVDDVVARDAEGNATRLRATVVPDTLGGKNPTDGRKVAGVIHWVDAATSIAAELRLYTHLFKVPKPEDGGGDFLEHLDRDSLQVITGARLEASLAAAVPGSRWQLERVGYFIVDQDSGENAPVLNRIVTLRDAAPKQAAAPIEKKTNVKATTRPKSKSPAEYRTEARARDADLAAAYAKAQELGLPAEQADLVSGDRATAALFVGAAAATNAAELVAKWIINELPRALGGKELADSGIGAAQLAELIALLRDQRISTSVGKTVLAQMVATGRPAAELAADVAATPAADLGSAIDAVIAANPDKAAQYRAGKTGLLGFFVGQVMKATPNADAGAVNQAVRSRLAAI
jgi:glutaminyl-tRNA synthetase